MDWMHLLLGPMMVVIAMITKYFPPRKINYIYGYRTARSMKSPEAWELANKYAANALLVVGLLTCLFQVVTYTWMSFGQAMLTSSVFLAITVVLVIPFTENHLKRHGF